MAKIHLIGANGYIGSLLIYYLKVAGHSVEIAKYRLPNIPEESIEADIVIHLAASGGGTEHNPRSGNSNIEQMKKVNIEGMHALLKGLKFPDTKIIFLSSTSVYGKFTESPLLDEQSPLLPISNYGIHKVQAEQILLDSSCEWMILRPCGIFGPSVSYNFGNSFLNVVIKNAILNNKITVLGGSQLIDTLYILDLIQILLRICNGEWHSKEIFNVGGKIISIDEMLTILAQTLDNIGIHCQIVFKENNAKPSMLTDCNKLRIAFPNWDNCPLERSLHTLVTNYMFTAQNIVH